MAIEPKADWPNVDEWRRRILAGWEKWGVTGQPLDPRTVEHLAHEFAKPPWEIKLPTSFRREHNDGDWW